MPLLDYGSCYRNQIEKEFKGVFGEKNEKGYAEKVGKVEKLLKEFDLFGDPKKAQATLDSLDDMISYPFFWSTDLGGKKKKEGAKSRVRTWLLYKKLNSSALRDLASQDNNVSLLFPISERGLKYFTVDMGMFQRFGANMISTRFYNFETCFRLLYMASKNLIHIEDFCYNFGYIGGEVQFKLCDDWGKIVEQGLQYVEDWEEDASLKKRIYEDLNKAMVKKGNGLYQLLEKAGGWWVLRRALCSKLVEIVKTEKPNEQAFFNHAEGTNEQQFKKDNEDNNIFSNPNSHDHDEEKGDDDLGKINNQGKTGDCCLM